MLKIAGAFACGCAVGSIARGFLYVGLIDLGVLLWSAIWWRTSLGDTLTLLNINTLHYHRRRAGRRIT